MQNAVVIDRHGCWLPNFLSKHKRLGSRLMRTPVNVNPSTSPLALREFANGSPKWHTEAALPGYVPLPSVELFEAFCKENLVENLPESCRGTCSPCKDENPNTLPHDVHGSCVLLINKC